MTRARMMMLFEKWVRFHGYNPPPIERLKWGRIFADHDRSWDEDGEETVALLIRKMQRDSGFGIAGQLTGNATMFPRRKP
jgi:hypothetical protein